MLGYTCTEISSRSISTLPPRLERASRREFPTTTRSTASSEESFYNFMVAWRAPSSLDPDPLTSDTFYVQYRKLSNSRGLTNYISGCDPSPLLYAFVGYTRGEKARRENTRRRSTERESPRGRRIKFKSQGSSREREKRAKRATQTRRRGRPSLPLATAEALPHGRHVRLQQVCYYWPACVARTCVDFFWPLCNFGSTPTAATHFATPSAGMLLYYGLSSLSL